MAALHTNDLSFVKGPPEEIEIECPICLQVMLDDPHLVLCCGHHFCGPCIKKVKHGNQPCPYCMKKEFQAVPDKGRLRIINGLQVNCTNKGCGWKGELKSLSSHINTEKREGECQFEVVKCKYDKCEVKPQRRHLKIHEEKKCGQRPYDCQYCRHKGTYQYITQQHYPQCTRYPVPCPNRCRSDGKFPCGDIESHLSTVCPLQSVECEFKWAGCHYSPLRKDVPQHNIESQLNHMSLLAKSCGELKKENEELKRELKKENEELKRELKKENEELKRELKKENEELKRELKKENEELKRELKKDVKEKLDNFHHAMVGDHHPLLPITVSKDDKGGGVRYFHSKPCGHLMSVKVTQKLNSTFIIINVYRGYCQFPLVSQINIKYKDRNGTTTIKTITIGNCWSYETFNAERSDVIQEFKSVIMNVLLHQFEIVSIN